VPDPPIEERVAKLEGRVTGFESHFDTLYQRFDVVDRRFAAMDQRFERVEQRIDPLDQKVDRCRAELASRITALDDKVSRHFVWLVGIQVSVLPAVVLALVGR
jgi:hypothetical protein